MALLAAWSGRQIEDARQQDQLPPAAVLWNAWMAALDQAIFAPLLDGNLDPVSPSLRQRLILTRLGQPQSLPVSPRWAPGNFAELVSDSLDRAVAELQERLGPDPASWRLPRPKEALTHPLLGNLGEIWLSNRATYGFKAEAGPAGLRVRSTFAPGQSGRVGADGQLDPHMLDLVEMYGRFEHKPEVWLSGGPS